MTRIRVPGAGLPSIMHAWRRAGGRPAADWRRRRKRSLIVAAAMVAAGLPLGVAATSALADPCGAGSNPIVCENSKAGSPSGNWYAPYAYGSIAGYTDKISYQAGDTVNFKVQSPASYKIEIYRLGWYGGDGARLMPTTPTATFAAKTQPACLKDGATGMTDCGNWSVTASWGVPSDAVSGVYIANLDQTDGNGLMTVAFVVRDDSSHSSIVVQTSDQTWEAYNNWGGANLYDGNGPAPDGRDYAVSYNRPTPAVGDNGLFGSEYAMIRFLERNGYDVSYLSGIDVSTNGSLLLNHKVFLASGHDEYWNQQQFDNVVAARKAGVNLAFFSGNEVFWRTRLASSIDSTADPNRTVACYKMTKMELSPPDGVADPSGQWTGTWMDPNGAGSGGYQPQNQLTGTLFMVNGYRSDAMTVPASYAKLRLWRNTAVAGLQPGQVTTFPTGVLGYEWDEDVANSVRPPGAVDLSSTTINITNGLLLQDYGNTYGNGVATHQVVMYRDPVSNALVFGSGTVQWSWGLDTFHVDDQLTANPPVDLDMQQATVNLLADMGAQPLTLMSGLTAAAQTSDTTGPNVTISTPSSGVTVPAMSPVTISGSAADTAGVVARVEVSTDGGTTWQPVTMGPAASTVNWTFSWTPTVLGNVTLQVRAEDDSANAGAVANLPLTVGPQQCPCTIFLPSAAPMQVTSGDPSAVELGVKFRTTQPGYITGVRFYKSTANTGTHTGSLWSSTGTLLATGTFTNETASGWQQLNFSKQVPVKANTTYVASYYAPSGEYSDDPGYFTAQGAGLPPLQAPQSGVDGANGVYRYGVGGGFPNQSFNATNYWVDVVMSTSGVTTTPPSVTNQTPAPGATGVPITTTVTAQFNEQIDPAALTFTLTDSGGATVPAAVTYDNTTDTATLTPGGTLGLGAAYTASVSASDPFGNTMTQPVTWSFTTSTTPPAPNCPCSLWNSSAPSSTIASSDTNAVELGTRFESAVSGEVTGVRFYNGAGDTSTHTGSLWDSSGNLLATGTFPGATGPGWETLTFATPVQIQANTGYVVSYHSADGDYSYTTGYFAAAHSSYPLTAPADGDGGSNGLYSYGTSTTFPTQSFGSTDYWADVIFTTTGGTAAASMLITGQTGTALFLAPAITTTASTGPWGTSHTRLGPRPAAIRTIIQKRHLHHVKKRRIFRDE